MTEMSSASAGGVSAVRGSDSLGAMASATKFCRSRWKQPSQRSHRKLLHISCAIFFLILLQIDNARSSSSSDLLGIKEEEAASAHGLEEDDEHSIVKRKIRGHVGRGRKVDEKERG